MMKRTLKSRMGGAAAALDRFETTWNKVARGEKIPAEARRKTKGQGTGKAKPAPNLDP
jgi:hypothetical protein